MGKWLLLWGACMAAASARSSARGWMRADLMALAPLCSQSPGVLTDSLLCCLNSAWMLFSWQLPSTTPVDSTFPQEPGSARGCGIRGHVELAVKPQVVPFSHFSLQTQEFELYLAKKASISCRCERVICCPCSSSYAWFPIWNMLNLSSHPFLPGFTPENHHKLPWLLAESQGCDPVGMGSGRAGGGWCQVWRAGLGAQHCRAGCSVTRSSECCVLLCLEILNCYPK